MSKTDNDQLTTQPFRDSTWKLQGACLGMDPELFIDDHTADPQEVKMAKAVCGDCPVLTTCLRQAVENKEPIGVWGGTTTKERKKIIATGALESTIEEIELRRNVEIHYMRGLSPEQIATELETDPERVQRHVEAFIKAYRPHRARIAS